ncbi:type II toxin-antitoxin system VapC family toxin [Candidatus Woesearchaeota archaeon]|nr:type II toxin-antitoxin system VapC family toxin [Candidatus Woesearchaeota archaeon]
MDKIIFLDANIFLEVALRDKKSENCKKLLLDINNGDYHGYTSDFIVYACLLQIQYKTKDSSLMKNFILFLNSINNLTVLRPSFAEMIKAAEYRDKYKLDFDDSLVVSSMVNNGIDTLISQDADFNKVSIIKVRQP